MSPLWSLVAWSTGSVYHSMDHYHHSPLYCYPWTAGHSTAGLLTDVHAAGYWSYMYRSDVYTVHSRHSPLHASVTSADTVGQSSLDTVIPCYSMILAIWAALSIKRLSSNDKDDYRGYACICTLFTMMYAYTVVSRMYTGAMHAMLTTYLLTDSPPRARWQAMMMIEHWW